MWVTIAFIAGLLLFDLWVFIEGGTDATISAMVVQEWSVEHELFTIFVGFIMGHFFLTQFSGNWVYKYPAIGFTCGAGLCISFQYSTWGTDYPYLLFALSAFFGGMFWPLGYPKEL